MIKKAITAYYTVSDTEYKQLKTIANEYLSAKNYLFARFSGVRSLSILNFRTIRNLIQSEKTNNLQFEGLKGHLLQRVENKVAGNIKAAWNQTLKKVKQDVTKSTILSDNEKHMIRILCNNLDILSLIFTSIDAEELLELPAFKKVTHQNIDYPKVQRWLKRRIRKYKSSIPHSRKADEILYDNTLYSNSETFNIQGLVKGKRINAEPLNQHQRPHKHEVVVKLEEKRIKVVEPINTKTKPIRGTSIIGLDKGYRDLLHSDSGYVYGQGYREKVKPYLERISKQMKGRNRFWSKYRNLLELGQTEKAERIFKHNLGRKALDRRNRKFKDYQKVLINTALNEMIEHERPSIVVLEDLSWSSKKTSNRRMNYELSSWAKGYLQNRLEYKSNHREFELVMVNPAYTSQLCHQCKHFGERNLEHFTCTNETCEYYNQTQNADTNAAKNIKERREDSAIDVYTSAQDVYRILEERIA